VIACGGGVVDREENVETLRRFREGGGVIVHVVRDKEEVVHYLIDEHRK
jgi:shikimate kinase